MLKSLHAIPCSSFGTFPSSLSAHPFVERWERMSSAHPGGGARRAPGGDGPPSLRERPGVSSMGRTAGPCDKEVPVGQAAVAPPTWHPPLGSGAEALSFAQQGSVLWSRSPILNHGPQVLQDSSRRDGPDRGAHFPGLFPPSSRESGIDLGIFMITMRAKLSCEGTG